MRITKLVLYNYKRLFLNKITKLEYTPTATMQIILGQNGSGKSSLLEQLTPLPANLKKDFNDDGYKEIHIEHHNSLYILTSTKPNTHHFVKDGIELNPGGTLRVQITLTEQHFNITPHIQQILLGKSQFCSMSPSERKRWMTHLSSIDYSYAIGVYNNLKQRHRDIVGGVKLLQANIFKLSKLKLSNDNILKLRNDRLHITNMIDQLLLGIVNTTSVDVDDQLNKLSSLLNTANKVGRATITNKELVIQKLEDTQMAVKFNEATLRTLYEENTKLEDMVPEERLTELDSKVKTLRADIEDIRNTNQFSKLPEIKETYTYLTNKYSDITSFISTVSEHIDLDISTSMYKMLTDEYIQLCNTKKVLDKKMVLLTAEIEHIESHVNSSVAVNCPSCEHKWTLSRDDTNHTTLVNDRESLTVNITELATEITTKEQHLQDLTDVRDIVKGYFRYYNYNNGTKFIKDWMISSDNKLGYQHTALPTVFEYIMSELRELYKIINIQTTIDKLEQEKRELLVKSNTKLEYITKAADTLKDSINKALDNNRNLKIEISKHTRELAAITRLEAHVEVLQSNVKLCYSLRDDKLKLILNEGLKALVSELRVILLDTDNKLKTIDETENLMNRYTTELDELQHKEKLLKITLKKLSPSEGLIAKSINSFLNEFINDMNETIASIWGYQMEILSCDLLDNDLDYKFKVLVDHSEVMEDISKTSSSMQEIINLVFKLAFAKYSNFVDYPLILDEFGKTFDTQHRVTAYNALDRDILLSVSQIYIVSHFESMYGRFGNADISILGEVGVDTNTITSYNEIMKIS